MTAQSTRLPAWIKLPPFLDIIRGAGAKAVYALLIFALAAFVLFRELETVTWHDVRAAASAVNWNQIAWAGLATAISYASLVGYDALALRHIGVKSLSWRLVALTSFVSQTFTFNLGFGILTGGAVRLRLYGAAGLHPDQIIKTSVFASAAFWLGLTAVCGASLLIEPQIAETVLSISAGLARAAGLALLSGVAAVLACSIVQPARLGPFKLQMPEIGICSIALLIGVVDIAASAFALWSLLPSSSALPFTAFLVVFATATALGVVSHVPGGLGVFEGVMLLSIPGVSHGEIIGALLLFRIIYYFIPLGVAAGLLVGAEMDGRHARLSKHLSAIGGSVGTAIPPASAALVLIGGLILLVSGALPAEHDRIAVLRDVVPLPFVETSHFFASVVGALLIVIAQGLVRRLHSAWVAASGLLVVGAAFSILKGIDYEEAVVCMAIAAILFAGRRSFYRQGGVFSGPVQPSEILVMGLAASASIWIGLLTYRNLHYHDALWWDFTYHGDAPRFMRASLGITITALLVTAYRMLNRPHAIEPPAPGVFESAAAIVAASDRVEPNLALLGDKRFLFNKDRSGFVMYGQQGQRWIAMGDPVAASADEASELVWLFKELVDRHAGVPVFYQVTTKLLPIYLDAGFAMMKLGEEAWVDLNKFTLEGSTGSKLRQAKTRAERGGATFEIVSASNVKSLLPELKAVSDDWLAERGSKEKGFSLGFWSDDYISRYDVAMIRQNGDIAAFANIWRSSNREEISVDLMRMRHDAAPGTMDLLFIDLMQAAKTEAYQWFCLGMAPLAGLPKHRLAPLWTRLGSWFSRHGDQFYKFEGLRAYKSKFRPEWRPKYLAYPGDSFLPQILFDVAALISSSPRQEGARGESGLHSTSQPHPSVLVSPVQ